MRYDKVAYSGPAGLVMGVCVVVGKMIQVLRLAGVGPLVILGLCLFSLFSSALHVYPVRYLGHLVAQFATGSLGHILGCVALYGGLLVASAVVRNLFVYWSMSVSSGIVRRLRQACFAHYINLDGREAAVLDGGAVMNKLYNATGRVDLVFSSSFFVLISDWIDFVFIVIIVGAMDWSVLLLLLSGYPVLMALIWLFNKKIAFYAKERLTVDGALMKAIASGQKNRDQAILYGAQGALSQAYGAVTDQERRNTLASGFWISAYYVVEKLVLAFYIFGALWILVGKQGVTLQTAGLVTSLVLYINQFYLPLTNFSRYLQTFQRGMAAVGLVLDFLATPSRQQRQGQNEATDAWLRLKAEPTSLGSTQLPFHQDWAFDAQGLYLVMGPSGCGKSTLMRSLAGLLDLEGVKVQGPLREGDVVYCDAIPWLFPGTVRSNLKPPFKADVPVTLSDEETALVDQLGLTPLLDQDVGDCGDALSMGQRARVLVARALLRKAPLSIFDESLANVDAESRRAMIEALVAAARERTVIILTHGDYPELQGRVKAVYAFEAQA